MQTLILRPIALSLLTLLLAGGCAFSKSTKATLRFHEQVSESLPKSHLVTVAIPRSQLHLAIAPEPTLTEKNIQSAELVPTAGGAAVMVRFDIHGTILLDELTTRNRGHYLVVMLNGTPTAAWLISQRLSLGQFLLEGDFTDEQAKQLVDALNAMAKKQPAW